MSNPLRPQWLQPTRLLCPQNSPGKNTGAGCHALLQGLFLTEDWNGVSYTAGRFFIIWTTREAQFSCSVCVQLFATPWTTVWQAALSFTISWSLLKFMSIESVIPSNHPILCHSILLLPSVFPASRSFPMSWQRRKQEKKQECPALLRFLSC